MPLGLLLAVLLYTGPCAPFLHRDNSSSNGQPANPDVRTPAPSAENKAVEATRIAVARQINVDPGLLTVESVQQVLWPDNCLAVPAAREICTPVETPGFRVVLAAGRYRFIYRTDLTGANVRFEELAVPGR